MSIAYTFKIISVDEAARCMEIVYKADGHPTQHISTRLPYVGEALETVVSMYAPIQFWLELQAPVMPPAVGISGAVASSGQSEIISSVPVLSVGEVSV